MRVLVTRPLRDAGRTAAALAAAGHEAMLAPVTRIEAVSTEIPQGPFAAVIATSAHAFEFLKAADVARLRDIPVFCAGARTAEAARASGFADARVPAADVAALLAGFDAPPGAVLYLAGRDRKPALEDGLRASGRPVETVIVYAAAAVNALPQSALAALRAGQIDAVLHYSRRSAELFLALAHAGSAEGALTGVAHVCISEDAAAPVVEAGLSARMAVTPDGAGMLAALNGGGSRFQGSSDPA